jgi:hypothetical protein
MVTRMNSISKTAHAMILAAPLLASAQTAPDAPSAASKAAPQLQYQSVFSEYRSYRDQPVEDWRTVNETVRAAASKGPAHGSHGAASDAAPTRAAPSSSAPADHPPAAKKPMHEQGGHDMHGGHK